ncbi:MAG: hypothetical protein AVDCRST_MAG79-1882 [uncultured Thermoleophilia bacterium]|uniref:Uncharacterized protein n=1 Tax=uncultured Thermoleophilia bacterium TaxID=1497501 RepID=A0A6J4U855_9ACTN|nr:MAG: hypothetical protein AVDCRST_MAG79-1882 [uncultured Thermoleophilia bacterium]
MRKFPHETAADPPPGLEPEPSDRGPIVRAFRSSPSPAGPADVASGPRRAPRRDGATATYAAGRRDARPLLPGAGPRARRPA